MNHNYFIELTLKIAKQLWNYAMHVLHKFFGLNINTTAVCLGRSNLHLLLLKSSMVQPPLIIKLFASSRSSLVEGDKQRDQLAVEHVCNVAMHTC